MTFYLWQNPSYILLQALYKHNESRDETRKLRFPDDASSIGEFQCLHMKVDFSWLSPNKIAEGQQEEVAEVVDELVENVIDSNKHIIENENECNLFDSNEWSVSDLASVLRECGILTRNAGRDMDKNSLLLRMKNVFYNRASSDVFKSSPLGHNWRGFWKPYIAEVLMAIFTVLGTLAAVHYLYSYCEYYHYTWNCSNWRKMYSLECYVMKKSRAYLEEMNYNLVYTTLCGLGIAMAGILSRAKAYATKNAGNY